MKLNEESYFMTRIQFPPFPIATVKFQVFVGEMKNKSMNDGKAIKLKYLSRR